MASRRKKAAAGGSSAKTDDDLATMVQSGPQGAYEALQLYRSRAIRLKNKNDVATALRSITSGSILLLNSGYENAAAELAEVLVEFLNETKAHVTDENKAMIFEIVAQFPPKSTHCIEFLKSCLKWSTEFGGKELGDFALHAKLAECLFENGDKHAASHFAMGEAPALYCTKIMGKYPSESEQEARDRNLTLGITHFLALENLRDAFELYRLYQRAHVEKGWILTSQLVQFNEQLLSVSRRDAAVLFKQIVNLYASVVDFDESVPTMLMGPIASKLFGIKPKVNPMMSMLHSMMTT